MRPYFEIVLLSPSEGVVMEGRWKGWLVRKHPDGLWVTVKKLPEANTYAEDNVLTKLFKSAS